MPTSCPRVGFRSRSERSTSGQGRPRIAERLPGVQKRLAVHVLVEDGEENEVRLGRARITADDVEYCLPHPAQVVERAVARWERQVPACRVADGGRVV